MSSNGQTPLPPALLWIGVPAAGIVLVTFFFVLGFPFDLVRDALAYRLTSASGAQVTIQQLGPGLSLGGPQLVAEGVRVTLSDGTPVQVETARLRPAWSFSWFRGTPALAIDLAAPEGRAVGTAWLGETPGFDGDLYDVALNRLPLERVVPELRLTGVAQIEVDLHAGESGPSGKLALRAREGSMGVPGLPIDLPFATLEGRAELGDGGAVRVEQLSLAGPLLSVEASGTLGPARRIEVAPLDATLRVEVHESGIRPVVQDLGVRLDPQGRAEVKLAGTLTRPVVR